MNSSMSDAESKGKLKNVGDFNMLILVDFPH